MAGHGGARLNPRLQMPTHGDVTPSPDQLDGWKDIAAYLGKSVRAAQRWERDMGLPVHRLKTPGGQVVFARPSEIDAWKTRVEVSRDDRDGVPEGQAGDRRRGERVGWALVVAAAVLFVLAAVMLAVAWLSRG